MEASISSTAISQSNYYEDVPSFQEQSALGKDEFLKLLITQLNYQDPLNPMEDRDFIAQMAQFSTLEQMLNMNDSLNKFLDHHMEGAFAQQAQLIGKLVSWKKGGNDSNVEQGIVQSISINDGKIYAEMDNGEKIPIHNIHKVEKADES